MNLAIHTDTFTNRLGNNPLKLPFYIFCFYFQESFLANPGKQKKLPAKNLVNSWKNRTPLIWTKDNIFNSSSAHSYALLKNAYLKRSFYEIFGLYLCAVP